MEEVIWKDVVGYEGIYRVSNDGNVLSIKYNCILKPYSDRAGYCKLEITKHKTKKYASIHRLVAEAFILNPENKKEVNHINGITSDNRVENLEWCTRSENMLHSYNVIGRKINTPMKGRNGENHNRSKMVIQLSLDGFILNVFGSSREAERYTGINHSSIAQCKKGNINHAGGFIWIG